MERVKTVREAYQQASHFLHFDGVANSSFEAEWMLRHLLHLDRTSFFMGLDQPFSEEKTNQLGRWLRARKQGVPLQYLVGEQYFYGRPFQVEPGVLFPSPGDRDFGRTSVTKSGYPMGSGTDLVVTPEEFTAP